MTRIIAGFAGSLSLKVPGAGTRPTSDRVREAIFSSLESRGAVQGARVLDLYAGSGALGLEAASRGASTVTLVERAPDAVRVCRSNIARVMRNAPPDGAPDVAVVGSSVQSFLDADTREWDVVFLDPPYELGEPALVNALSALAERLEPEAIVMVERASKHAEPAWPAGLTIARRRNYGDTTLWWLARSTGPLSV